MIESPIASRRLPGACQPIGRSGSSAPGTVAGTVPPADDGTLDCAGDEAAAAVLAVVGPAAETSGTVGGSEPATGTVRDAPGDAASLDEHAARTSAPAT